jgi:hypothetical protein
MARVVIHQRGVRWQCNDSTDSDLFVTEYCGTDILSWIHSEQANATLLSPIKIEDLYVDRRIPARNFRAIFIHTCTLLEVVRREARLGRGGGFKGYVLIGRGEEEVILMSWTGSTLLLKQH